MSDFHTRLADATSKLPGVRNVRLVPKGVSTAGRRLRRHPHLAITLINDVSFPFPLRDRPKDHSRGYFLTNLHTIRREIAKRCDLPPPKVMPAPTHSTRRHKHCCCKTRSLPVRPLTPPIASTRLDRDPFRDALTALATRIATA